MRRESIEGESIEGESVEGESIEASPYLIYALETRSNSTVFYYRGMIGIEN